jgi:hypothetical protein
VWDPWDKQNSLAWILSLIINSVDLMGRHPAPVHTKEKVVGREMTQLVLSCPVWLAAVPLDHSTAALLTTNSSCVNIVKKYVITKIEPGHLSAQ